MKTDIERILAEMEANGGDVHAAVTMVSDNTGIDKDDLLDAYDLWSES